MSSDDAVESPRETYAIGFVRDGMVIAQASCETEDPIEPGTGNTLGSEPTHDVVGECDERHQLRRRPRQRPAVDGVPDESD